MEYIPKVIQGGGWMGHTYSIHYKKEMDKWGWFKDECTGSIKDEDLFEGDGYGSKGKRLIKQSALKMLQC